MSLSGLGKKELEDAARSALCTLFSLFPQIGLFYLFVFKQFR